jgi:selT/selW/selH-like putative selenoprotein
LASALTAAYPDIEIELIKGKGGCFEVVVDGNLVFSKKATGRHTSPEEVLSLIKGGA